jgi:hypothetical protein
VLIGMIWATQDAHGERPSRGRDLRCSLDDDGGDDDRSDEEAKGHFS